MSINGWERKQAVRGPTYILTYESPERQMTVLITSRTIAGSQITITVSPRNDTQLQNISGGNSQQPVIPR